MLSPQLQKGVALEVISAAGWVRGRLGLCSESSQLLVILPVFGVAHGVVPSTCQVDADASWINCDLPVGVASRSEQAFGPLSWVDFDSP